MPLAAGTRLGPYEIVELRGRGGMGEVYRARDTRLGRDVAVKVLPRELSSEPAFKERFEREARTISQLQHPNVCALYDIGSEEGLDFLVMEYLEGETLEDRLRRGALPAPEGLRIGVEIAAAVEAAHRKGVVHRDLKPGNVMLTEAGTKVLDFGLAREVAEPKPSSDPEAGTLAMAGSLTVQGQILGTVPYMSPEQLHGRAVAPPSDVFSLGVVLYEMLAGSRPFGGDTQAALISSILRDRPPPPSALAGALPSGLDALVARCLEKEPERRFASASEVRSSLDALRRELDSGAGRIEPFVPGPATKSYRTRLVGRDAERSELHRALERAADGAGSLVTLAGEPGVGKTRLSMDLMDRARERGFVALVGHSYEGEGARPWSPWIEILDATQRIASKDVLRDLLGDGAPEIAKLQPALRRLFPDLPPALDLPPEAERGYLFDCFCDFVARASALQPLLFVLEDLHWADEPTLLLLRRLCHRFAELPILVIGTYRDVELDVDRPLAEALRELVRERLVERIALHRLGPEGVAEMIEALAGRRPPAELVAAIHGETEGNPFFVEEVYAHLDEEGRLFDRDGRWRNDLSLEQLDVPEGVRLVLGRRLERLDDDGRRVLTAGAVVGRRFSYPLLEAVVGSDSGDVLEHIEAAERLHLVEPDASSGSREPRYRFAHELIRQTLLQGLSMPRRQRLHLRVAEALERTYGARLEEEHAAAMAHHLYQSGAAADEAKTIRFLTLAGDQALTAGAFEDALDHFENAVELIDEREPAIRAGILVKRAQASSSVGRTERAIADLETACVLYEELGDLEAVGGICGDFAMHAAWRADSEQALPLLERGLAAVGGVEPSGVRCRLLSAAGMMLVVRNEVGRGSEMLDQALRMAEELGEDRLIAEVQSSRSGTHWYRMTAGAWAEDGPRAERLWRELDDQWQWLAAAAFWKVGLAFAGRPSEAVAGLDRLQQLADRLGHTQARVAIGVARGFGELQLSGDIERFRTFGQWYCAYCQEIDYPWEFVGWGHLGLCDFWQGEWERSVESFERSLRIETAHPSALYGWGNYYMVLSHFDPSRAEELFESRRHLFPVGVEGNGGGAWIALMRGIEGHAARGLRERAAELYPLTLGAIETGTVVEHFSTTMPQLAAAIAAACGERWEEAEEHYRTGLRQAEEVPHRLMQPEFRRWYARMLLERGAKGDRERARTLLGEAIAAYDELGMPRHLEMARELGRESL